MNRRAFNQTLSLALSSLPLIAFTSVGMGSQKSKKPKTTNEWQVYSHEELRMECLLPPGASKEAQGLGAVINRHEINCSAIPNENGRCRYTEGFLKGISLMMEGIGYTNMVYKVTTDNSVLITYQRTIQGVVHKRVEKMILHPVRIYRVSITAPMSLYDESIQKRIFDSFKVLSNGSC